MLNISQKEHGNVVVLTVYGRVDHASSGELEKSIFHVINEGHNLLILDFSNFNYMSSSGLRVLLLALKTLKLNQGSMVLASMPPHIYEVFEMSGFHTLFKMADTVEDAVDLLSEDSRAVG